MNPQLIFFWTLVGFGGGRYIPNPDDDTPPRPPWPGPWPWIKLASILGAIVGGVLYSVTFMTGMPQTGVEIAVKS